MATKLKATASRKVTEPILTDIEFRTDEVSVSDHFADNNFKMLVSVEVSRWVVHGVTLTSR